MPEPIAAAPPGRERRPRPLTRAQATTAMCAACTLLIGLVCTAAWLIQDGNYELNDSGGYRAPPSQLLTWAAAALPLAGAGVLIGVFVLRRWRRVGWSLVALTGIVAIALPVHETDWGFLVAKRHFDAIAAPDGSQPKSFDEPDEYHASLLLDNGGAPVGRTFERRFRRLGGGPLDLPALLIHYRNQLPGYDCRIIRTPAGVACSHGSASFAAFAADADGHQPYITRLTTCSHGGDATGPMVPSPPLPCGAARGVRQPG